MFTLESNGGRLPLKVKESLFLPCKVVSRSL